MVNRPLKGLHYKYIFIIEVTVDTQRYPDRYKVEDIVVFLVVNSYNRDQTNNFRVPL